jgi:iron complex transport system substrate-binding protein
MNTNRTIGRMAKSLVAAAVALVLASGPVSGQAQGLGNPSQCLQTFDPNADYFVDKVSFEQAEGISVTYGKHYKYITVKQPWAGAESGFSYLLVQCGAPTPTDAAYADAQVIQVPVRKFVSLSTTYLPHLVALEVVDALVAVDTIAYANTPEVLALHEAGKIEEVGGGAGGEINLEKIALLAPDLIMTYGSGSPEYDAHPKLLEAGFKVALAAEYLERTPLGQAEWLKFTALFFNKEAEANAYINMVTREYNALLEKVMPISATPSVITNIPYQGTWYMPGGASFVATLLRDSVAFYLWAGDTSTGSLALSVEEVLLKGQDAMYWLNVGFATDLASLIADDPRLAEFAAYKSGRVYNNNARSNANGGNDYYESGVINPHLILADLITIFHPGLLDSHTLYYYQQLK